MKDELEMIWEGGRGLIEVLSHDTWSRGQDSNLQLLKYQVRSVAAR
jgi:hypothetical protein